MIVSSGHFPPIGSDHPRPAPLSDFTILLSGVGFSWSVIRRRVWAIARCEADEKSVFAIFLRPWAGRRVASPPHWPGCFLMLVKQWSFGDKVVHLDRPEWGAGVVNQAQPDTHEGKSCQRLTIRFERAGVKTLTTGIANLCPAEDAPRLHAAEHHEPDPLFAQSNQAAVKEVMLKLPDAANDPFTPPAARLKATFLLYRYSEHGSALLDWAAAQTGLKDPMTRFSRHELEELYRRFTQVRDDHLRKLVQEFKKNDPVGLAAALKLAPRSAQQALRRFDNMR